MKKRIISVFLAVLFIVSCFTFSSCTPGTSPVNAKPGKGALTTRSLNNIYSAQDVSVLGTQLENVQIGEVFVLGDDKLLVSGNDKKTYEMKYYITDLSFKNCTEVTLCDTTNENAQEYVNMITVDKDGGAIWYIKNIYYYNTGVKYPVATDDIAVEYGVMETVAVNDVAIMVEPEMGFSENEEKFFLVKMDYEGNVLVELDLSDMMLVKESEESSYRGWVNSMNVLGNNLVLNISSRKLCVIDAQNASVVKEIEISQETYMDRLLSDSKNNLYYILYGEKGMELHRFDLETQNSTPIELPMEGEKSYNYQFHSGDGGYDFLLTNDMAFYGFNIGDSEITEICNYANSDLNVMYGVTPVFLSDGRLFVSYYDYTEDENVSLILTKVNPEDVKEKYLITVAAGNYLDREIRSAFIKFNRTSDEYKIIFKDYSEYNNESNQWNGANAKLAEDIVNNAPGAADIVLFDSYFDYESLTSKGALADLNRFIDSDSSFNREDYLPGVLESLEEGGKLYMLTPTVNFYTIAVKKSLVNGKKNWTMKEFLEIHNSLPDGERMIAEATREDLGKTLLNISLSQYIDYNTGRCSFDSDDFKSLLKYLKDLPEDYTAFQDEWENNNNYWLDMEMSYSKGTTKAYPAYISSFAMRRETEAVFGGEDVEFIGFPTTDKDSSGAIIYPGVLLAINANSKVSAGAWSAIKYLFSDEYQNNFAGSVDENGSVNTSYQFPVKKSMIEKKMATDIMPRFWVYTDENGEEVKEYYGNTMWLGEGEIELRDITEEDTDVIWNIVLGANTMLTSKDSIIDIIEQEAAAFYNDEKSIDEVVSIINSRVQLYVSERL